ncbi:MAG: toll/interleukin-1 receptor domain-containing protein [Alteraurantiacibacter sp.]
MVDVFISYSRTNKDKVSKIARAIEEAGYEVWWDAELPPHQSYGDVITAKIQMAKAAVVVWSAEAAASEWVRAEADVARNQKKLIQTALGDITPPLPFNQIQYANLGDWDGEQDHPEFRKVKASLAALCGARDAREGGAAYPFPAAPPKDAADAAPQPSTSGPPTPRPKPAPALLTPTAAVPLMAQPPKSSAGVERSGGVPVPVVIGGLVALLGLAGAGWWVLSRDSGEGEEDKTPTAEASAEAAPETLLAADNRVAPDEADKPDDAPAPAPAPAPVQQAAPAPGQQQFNRDVRLVNQTGDTIMYIYWSDTGQANWGNDRLGSDVLAAGSYWDVTVDDGSGACEYDMMAVTSAQRQIVHNAVNVCSVSSVTFN